MVLYMDMETADFITVKALVDLFIKQEHIINRLDMIKNQSINDWEKWLQLELEFFMRQHESIANVEREVPYLCDRRSAPDRFTMFVDLKFRKKRARLDSYIFLELKCSRSPTALINNMEKDIKKLSCMRASGDDGRSFWCVGFYTNTSERSATTIKKRLGDYYYKHHESIPLQKGEIGYVIM
ncbi:hypothetical protein CD201_03295 [Hafnia alvei]|nr:hypothetical protein CD201_03295 [Hafnia alvei]